MNQTASTVRIDQQADNLRLLVAHSLASEIEQRMDRWWQDQSRYEPALPRRHGESKDVRGGGSDGMYL